MHGFTHRFTQGLFVNIITSIMLFAAFYLHSVFWEQVVVYLLTGYVFIGILRYSRKVRIFMRKIGAINPIGLSFMWDGVFVAVLALNGHSILAALYVIASMQVYGPYIYEDDKL